MFIEKLNTMLMQQGPQGCYGGLRTFLSCSVVQNFYKVGKALADLSDLDLCVKRKVGHKKWVKNNLSGLFKNGPIVREAKVSNVIINSQIVCSGPSGKLSSLKKSS